MITDSFLSRLDRVKETGPGRWLACCPSHDDRSPSLAIREVDDGRTLLHCFAGCGATEIVQSIGLEMHDLYPNSSDNRKSLKPHERWIPRDVIKALADEIFVVVLAASATLAGKKLTESDYARLLLATNRIDAASREVGCD